MAFSAIARSQFHGMTADEVARALGETVLAIRPRITELKKAGAFVCSGGKRPNISGVSADVMVIIKYLPPKTRRGQCYRSAGRRGVRRRTGAPHAQKI